MRGRSPLGNPLLWVVFAIALPEVIKKCKPMAKVVGDALCYAGEVFHKAAEPVAPPVTTEPSASEPVADATPTESPATEDKE